MTKILVIYCMNCNVLYFMQLITFVCILIFQRLFEITLNGVANQFFFFVELFPLYYYCLVYRCRGRMRDIYGNLGIPLGSYFAASQGTSQSVRSSLISYIRLFEPLVIRGLNVRRKSIGTLCKKSLCCMRQPYPKL